MVAFLIVGSDVEVTNVGIVEAIDVLNRPEEFEGSALFSFEEGWME